MARSAFRFASRRIAIFFALFALISLTTAPASASPPARILSLAPVTTEILYDLGLGDRVVGVTKWCNWPPEAAQKPQVPDMMNVSVEAAAGFAPDLIVLSNMNGHVENRLRAFGFNVVAARQDDFGAICESMIEIGRACGVEEAARARVEELRAEVRGLAADVPDGPRPRVLVSVGRDTADGTFRRVFAASRGAFYTDLVREAGGENASERDEAYTQYTREGLIRVDPDIVIELAGDHGAGEAAEVIAAQWEAFTDLRAAADGRVSIITGDVALRPGPRYPAILRAFIRAIQGGERLIDGASGQ